MAYSDKHKQFLQHCMQERMLSEKMAKSVNSFLFPGKVLDNTIEIINTKLAPLEFKINKTVCEQNGGINYVFVTLFNDDLKAKKESIKTVFKLLVNYIVLSGGFVPYSEAIKFNNQMSETIIKTFFSNKYLIADNFDNIYLSALAMSELEGYLAENFKDKRCMSCMSIVGHGIKCPSCEQFVHGHCFEAYCKNIGSKKCPKCSKLLPVEWDSIEIVNKL